MSYFLAVDQGGSKTEALVFGEDGAILAFGDDRGVRQPGESYAQKQGFWIRSAARRALEKAGLAAESLSGAACALNGADWPEDYDRLRGLVSDELGLAEADILIVNDCIGAMRGGAAQGNRAVICAGSGMNCAVRAADGREHVFGYFVSPLDQGGGALGTQAWQAILDAYSGLGPPTMLTALLLEMHGESELVALYRKFTTGRAIFRNFDLCPLLMRAAREGDAVAAHILEGAARRMVHYIASGITQLGLGETPVSLVLTGGVFKGDGDVFFALIRRIVGEKGLLATCVQARYEPVAGTALLLLDGLPAAQRSAGLARFEEDANSFGLQYGLQHHAAAGGPKGEGAHA